MSNDPKGFELINPKRKGFSILEANNWYTYCSNNPVRYVDPSGLDDVDMIPEEAKPYLPEWQAVSAHITIERQHDGYGNTFDSTRTLKLTLRNGKTKSFTDSVGSNAVSEEFADEHGGMTVPDGEYMATTAWLTEQEDGTYDSASYANVLRIVTNDPNISEEDRDTINGGMFLFHATENKAGSSWTKPWSAGCTSGKGGQAGQDAFMGNIPNNIDINDIGITIRSLSNERFR